MIDMLINWLKSCPQLLDIQFGALPPGAGTGLFAGGIEAVQQDILGNSRTVQRYILRHRAAPDSTWAQQVSGWVLSNQPPSMAITPKGGKLVSPTNDGWGTWELELVIVF